MFHSYQKPSFLLTCIFLLLSASLKAGVVYEIEVKDHEQSPPKTESIEAAVEGRNLKMGVASQGPGAQDEMIYRGDRREMVVVSHEHRSYHIMNEATMRAVAGQVNDAMSQMQEMLKNVPADKRAMVEQMMKQKMPSQPATAPNTAGAMDEIRNTGQRAEKEGYPCVKYEIINNGRKVRELWVTDWSNIEGGSDVVDAFEDMADFYGELMDAMPNMGQDDSSVSDNVFEHMRELGGFPVVDREYGADGSLESEATLRSARRQTLDPDAFDPPSGYKRQEMFSP